MVTIAFLIFWLSKLFTNVTVYDKLMLSKNFANLKFKRKLREEKAIGNGG